MRQTKDGEIKDDALVVAVTRDGRIYLGSMNVQDKIRNYLVVRLISFFNAVIKVMRWRK